MSAPERMKLKTSASIRANSGPLLRHFPATRRCAAARLGCCGARKKAAFAAAFTVLRACRERGIGPPAPGRFDQGLAGLAAAAFAGFSALAATASPAVPPK